MSDEEEMNDNDEIIKVGDHLPAFTVEMHDGSLVSASSLLGKPSVIVFFSTTCPDCQRELPQIDQRYLNYSSDTTYIAIAREQTDDAVSAYWSANNLSIPFSPQQDRHIYNLFANKGIPRVYKSDANGIVIGIEK